MNVKKEDIENLERILSEMKKEYEIENERAYRASKHKKFNIDDWIINGKQFGKVGWVENKVINLNEEDGYVGINLYSGSRGFCVCKRDDWSLMSDEDIAYLTTKYKIKLTGEELQVIIPILIQSCSNIANDVAQRLKEIGEFSFNKKQKEKAQ